jgi:hypothetical protein
MLTLTPNQLSVLAIAVKAYDAPLELMATESGNVAVYVVGPKFRDYKGTITPDGNVCAAL